MRRILLSSVTFPFVPYFSTLSYEQHHFRGGGGFIENKLCVLIFSTASVGNISCHPKGKGTDNVYLVRGHEDFDVEWGYNSALSLSLALDGVGAYRHALSALLPATRPGTHCIAGWMGPRADVYGLPVNCPLLLSDFNENLLF
jgi:hypothetical protein